MITVDIEIKDDYANKVYAKNSIREVLLPTELRAFNYLYDIEDKYIIPNKLNDKQILKLARNILKKVGIKQTFKMFSYKIDKAFIHDAYKYHIYRNDVFQNSYLDDNYFNAYQLVIEELIYYCIKKI